MPVDFSKKICFIHIPKTGGTTIVKTLGASGIMDWSITGTYKPGFSYDLPGSLDDISWFDPMYDPRKTWQLHHLTLSDIKVLCSSTLRNWHIYSVVRNPWDRMVSIFEYGRQTGGRTGTKGLSFSDWIKEKQINNLQYPYLARSRSNRIADFPENIKIFQFPDLSQCIEDICKISGRPVPNNLYHEKRTSRRRYQTYYTDDTKQIVAEESHIDIDKFGFRF